MKYYINSYGNMGKGDYFYSSLVHNNKNVSIIFINDKCILNKSQNQSGAFFSTKNHTWFKFFNLCTVQNITVIGQTSYYAFVVD